MHIAAHNPANSTPFPRIAWRAALLVMLVSLTGFALLGAAVHAGGVVVRFDEALAAQLHQGATPGLITAMRVVTLLGLQGLWVLMAVAGVALLLRRRWLLLAALVVSWVGGVALNTVAKAIFVRPRPVFDAPLLTAAFYSFPSGHAMFSTIVYGMLAYLLVCHVRQPVLRFLIMVSAGLLIVLVAFSRIYLGVHYLSDVAAGILLGLAWLLLCILGLEFASRRLRSYHKPDKG